MDGGQRIDAGSFLLAKDLARIEGKIDVVLQRQAQAARVRARILMRVEQIAIALEVDREVASLNLHGDPPTPEK